MQSIRNIRVAIDGAAASGKSTIGRALVERFGGTLFDTGLTYRMVAYNALEQAASPSDVNSLLDIVTKMPPFQFTGSPRTLALPVPQKSLLTDAVGTMASLLSQHAAVRHELVMKQREAIFASFGFIVVAGRDIGTVVLRDDATIKLFLTASSSVRAGRRGVSTATNKKNTLTERDRRDMEREASPLRPAEDAIIIVTDELTVEQTTNMAVQLIYEVI